MSEEKSKADPTLPYKVWLAGLGALSQAREEGSDLFDKMVDRGREVVSDRTGKVKDEVGKIGTWFDTTMGKIGNGLDQRLQDLLQSLGFAARDEVHDLTQRVTELEEKLRKAAAAKTAVKVFLVSSHPDGWQLQAEGTREPLSVHRTKADAVAAGKQAAAKAAPSRLVIHRKDGAVQSETDFD
jgi:poly(hydroxyalkanoate) granule-associated protein